MTLMRREVLHLTGAALAVSSLSRIAEAQTSPAGPKISPIVRKDLVGQDQTVQESVISVAEFGPGIGAPWHMHPGAQEILYVQEGNLTVEVEDQGVTVVKAGEAAIIAAEVPHLARNESTSASAKALVIHSRSAKDKPLVLVVKRST